MTADQDTWQEEIEQKLDSFAPEERRNAVAEASNKTDFPKAEDKLNMHLHSFFSYNAQGYSPSHLAYCARKNEFCAAGMVDFDVLDGLEEFYTAGEAFNIPVAAGVESRVFVPEFSDREINSPGEPGIAYHVGMGIPQVPQEGFAADFLQQMRDTAYNRTRELLERVNDYLKPVTVDYEHDVLPLTPAGNATERHLCEAIAKKAAAHFNTDQELADYWKEKLGMSPDDMDLPAGPAIQGAIRKKTMKKGGVGYVQPGQDSYPLLADMNKFIVQSGGIPVIAWLDGTTEGEQDMENLCRTAMATGAAALNIIPARNYTSGKRDEKLDNLYQVVELCRNLKLPVLAGTEMNSPTNKIVNEFESPELKPLWDDFYNGAMITVGHAALQRNAGLGYLSDWASSTFRDKEEKNNFFSEVGHLLNNEIIKTLKDVSDDMSPHQIIDLIKTTRS